MKPAVEPREIPPLPFSKVNFLDSKSNLKTVATLKMNEVILYYVTIIIVVVIIIVYIM